MIDLKTAQDLLAEVQVLATKRDEADRNVLAIKAALPHLSPEARQLRGGSFRHWVQTAAAIRKEIAYKLAFAESILA